MFSLTEKQKTRISIIFAIVQLLLAGILLCSVIFNLLTIGVLSLYPYISDTQFVKSLAFIITPLLSYSESFIYTNAAFDLWVGIGLILCLHSSNCFDKEKFGIKEAIYSFIGLALVLGRPSTYFFTAIISGIPHDWWLLWPLKYILLPPIILFIYGIINIFVIYFAITLFILTVVYFPLKIFDSVLRIANTLAQVKAQKPLFIQTLLGFFLWFTGQELPKNDETPDESKGARFATDEEAESLRREGEGLMAFGHLNGHPFFLKNKKHVLIMASTRSGKGYSLIIPHLLRYPGSAFVLDPKGENAFVTGSRREKINDKVLYLDPFGISGKKVRARFNPLAHFTPENMEAESKALAAALVMGEFGKRDHWTSSARQLVAAIILFVVTTPLIPPEEKDLRTVRQIMLARISSALKEMSESDAADGLLSLLATSFINTPKTEFGSILSTAQRETEILDNPFILESLSASGEGEEIDFSDWHKETMTVFLCLSAPMFPIFNRWLRLVLTSALDEMTHVLNPPSLPVCFMLDELATLGHLQLVEDAVGLSAGYGVQLVNVFQDVAQMRDLYKGRWASFISNSGVKAVFSLNDYDTAFYWSQTLGTRLFETTSQQQDVFGIAKSQSKGETMRPLLSSDKLLSLFAEKQMLVLPEGSPAIISERVGYIDDQTLLGLWDDPRGKEIDPDFAYPTPE